MKNYLLLALLLVGLVGWKSRDSNPALITPAGSSVSYQCDGQTIMCSAKAVLLFTPYLLMGDILWVEPTTVTQPPAGVEVLYVFYHRLTSSPTATFFLNGCTLLRKGGWIPILRRALIPLCLAVAGAILARSPP